MIIPYNNDVKGRPAGEMTFVDVSDRPIEYFKTSYRADRFTRRNQLERVRPTSSSKLL